jgi:repressor LexA
MTDRTTVGDTNPSDESALASVSPLPEQLRIRGLTYRQKRILEFIKASVDERGYPPTMREIGEAVGLASPSSVHVATTLQKIITMYFY